MMQDAESLSPFEEQRSFSKLKSLDKTRSHNLWFKAHKVKPLQHKRKIFSLGLLCRAIQKINVKTREELMFTFGGIKTTKMQHP